jgi:pimeloyl-ACP methyl ester carboxylesterase
MADSSDDSCLKTLTIGIGDDARAIAVRQRKGKEEAGNPGLFWLGGFKSDMMGTKAEALDRWGAAHGRAVTRFDYSGHGESGGSFRDGSIGRWLEESLAVYRQFCRGPQVVIGSSMGGWLALLLAQALREQGNGAASDPHGEEARSGVSNHEAAQTPAYASLAGMVLIAPAVDFTEVLMWDRFDAEVKREIKLKGAWSRPSQYSDEPYVITRRLIEEGRKHLLLDGVIETGCPVRILQGVQDPDVPWQHAAELVSRFVSDDVVFTLIKDGDHRLSRPEDIERLLSAVGEF